MKGSWGQRILYLVTRTLREQFRYHCLGRQQMYTAQGLYFIPGSPNPPTTSQNFRGKGWSSPDPPSFVELGLRVLGFVKVRPAISGIHPARCIQVFGPQLWLLGPNTINGMVFGTRNLQYQVRGPSGLGIWESREKAT